MALSRKTALLAISAAIISPLLTGEQVLKSKAAEKTNFGKTEEGNCNTAPVDYTGSIKKSKSKNNRKTKKRKKAKNGRK